MAEKRTVPFDHHTAEWVEDPYTVYRELRNECPVAFTEAHGGFWLLSRYQDVREALLDWQTFSSNHPGRVAIPHTRPGAHPGIPIEFDPPEHTRYRDLISRYFSPSEVKKLEPQITRFADDLVAGFHRRGACDIVRDYAAPLVAGTLARFLALPLEDVSLLDRWADAIFAGRVDDPEGAARALEALSSYLGERLEERKQRPGDDLFSALVKAEVGGRRLTDRELLGYGRTLLLAGREAAIDGLANSLWYLAQHPERRWRLRGEPELLPFAIEEFLRTMSHIQLLGRVATRNLELHGQTICEGESVAMIYGSGNRDERVFTDPDRVVLDRKPNPHIAFGSAHHYCLGAHLARLIMRVGIGTFLEAIPDFRLSQSEEIRRKLNGDARGFVTLPIEFARA
ncbi:MAG: cytochrome P450 [Truepera sp.]|nr:cytochrome P450 [Truepera sp.]